MCDLARRGKADKIDIKSRKIKIEEIEYIKYK